MFTASLPRTLHTTPGTAAQFGERVVELGLDHPANAAGLAELVRAARANLVNPTVVDVLLDPAEPEVARLRAYAVVARIRTLQGSNLLTA